VICTLKLFDEAIRLLIPPDEDPEDGELTMVIIDVQNSTSGFFGGFGGVDINTEQYKHNVSFNFGDNAQVLSATMLDKHPSDVEELVDPKTFPQDKLTLAPILLNQGDWIRLGAVVQTPANTAERSPRVVTANGRIMGIRRIQKKRPPGSLAWLSLGLAQAPFVLIFLFTVAGFLFEWMFGRQFPDLSDAFFLYVLAWAATFYLFTAFLGLLSLRRYIRKWRVAQRFSHPTPESWAPAVVRISGLFILVVALEATIMTLVFAGRLSIASFLVVLVLFD
jgi:hypothetical protein